MSVLADVLNFVQQGVPVPTDVFRQLSAEEQTALRELEQSRQADTDWREITLSILGAATDLSRTQDRMKVLAELVHSSRQIIDSDVAYISLNSPETADTRVLTTSGVVTELFRNIRIPLGVGVLGSVAATRRAAWTFDHLNDPNVTHVPEVDEAVQAEGIRGILGAPLVIGGEIIGALMVGDRRPRAYTADEVIILDSLASLASVALETSQLIEDLEENIEAVRRSHRQSEEQIRQLQALSTIDAYLVETLAKGTGPKAIEEVIRENLHCDSWLWRDNELLLLPDGEPEVGENFIDTMRVLIQESRETGGIAMSDSLSAVAISVNQRYLGAICVNRVVDESQMRILHRVAQTYATMLIFRQALLDAESRQISDLLRKVIVGTSMEEDLTRIAKMTGINIRENGNLYLAAITSVGALPNPRTVDRLLGKRGIAFGDEQHVCVVVDAEAGVDQAFREVFEASFEHGENLYIGAAPFPEDLSQVMEAHDQAVALSVSMRSLKLSNQVATRTTYGVLGLLLSTDAPTIHQIVEDTIGELVGYDGKHRTELTQTAAAFFDHGRSVSLTARALFVHENTVRQRIERIGVILGSEWSVGTRAFDIHLALRAWQITR